MMQVNLTERVFDGMDGAHAALFTPFTADNHVNPDMIEKIMEYGIANGLKGFYLTGSTGEGFLLNEDERKLVMKKAVEVAKGRCKLIAHVGCLATDDAVKLARYAADIGIDWVSSVAPVYFGQSFEAAYRHYKMISEATDLPFMVYSIGAALHPERDIRFFDLKNVKGMKYTGRDYYAAQCLTRKLDKEAIFFAGCDEQLLCALALGNVFSGGIGTTYNIIPKHFADICALADAGDFKAAAVKQDEANRVVELMIESENWTTRKAMMRYIGLDCGNYRAPYAPITEDEYQAFIKRFAALGIVKENQAIAS